MQWVAAGPSLRLYTLFGITVRLHWTFLFLPLIALVWVDWETAQFHWAMALIGAVFATVLLHEYGHALTARRLGAGSHEIMLGALGGAALCGEGRSAGEDILIAFAGPMVNILLFGALLVPISMNEIPIEPALFNPLEPSAGGFWVWLYKANLFLLAFNLLPVYPLDGGRIFTGLIALRRGRRRALLVSTPIAAVLAAGLLAVAFVLPSLLLGLIAAVTLWEALRVYRLAKGGWITEYPSTEGGMEWESDFEWAGPERSEEPQEGRPGFFARWFADRRRRKRERNQEKEVRLRQDVDVILEKVSREGMGALTPRERKTLAEASRRMRQE